MAAIPGINPSITAAVNSTTPAAAVTDKETLASNFTAFLQLLTTQLKNQNPLDPLDTNQFTQQLVQFAQVEQQLKSNDQLANLVSLQKTAQATAALDFVGQTVSVDGSTARLANGEAAWALQVPKPAVVTLNIKNATGQQVFAGTYTMGAGTQTFRWDGRSNGVQWPAGNYTIAAVAKDASGGVVGVATEIQDVVDSADLTQNPPVLSVAGQDYTLDKIKRVVRRAN
jgi:flagellar basal-body rod modification protein FlgD